MDLNNLKNTNMEKLKPADTVDLEIIVKTWAQQMFEYNKNKEQARIPKDQLVYTINWRRVKFLHHPPQFGTPASHKNAESYPKQEHVKLENEDSACSPKSERSEEESVGLVLGEKDLERPEPSRPKSQVLFRTNFANSTDQDQEYTFRTERTTCSSCDVSFERALTVGMEMNLSLKTPCEVFDAHAGFKREISVSNAQGQSIEESLTWGVDSLIKVPANHRTVAELVVYEREFGGPFKVKTEFSGKVLVSVTNARSNNCFVMSIEGDIAEIIKSQDVAKVFSKENKVVSFNTKGCCNFRFAIEQQITVRQEPL